MRFNLFGHPTLKKIFAPVATFAAWVRSLITRRGRRSRVPSYTFNRADRRRIVSEMRRARRRERFTAGAFGLQSRKLTARVLKLNREVRGFA